MASIRKLSDGRWQARYRVTAGGKQYSKTTRRKIDAQRWLDERTAAVQTGMHVDPRTARTTVEQWSALWLDGYGTRRESTVRQARVHVAKIVDEFGPVPLSSVRPSQVRAWCSKLAEDGHEPSYVYALHARLAQIFSDAVHDGLVPRNPCSRRTSPPMGRQRPYVATTEQVWALHDAMPAHLRAAVLLSAFVGLRTAEVCGLRVSDIDFMRGVVHPAVQYPAAPVKSETSRTGVPIPHELALGLAAHVEHWSGPTVMTNELGRQLPPWALERAIRTARAKVDGLPDGFRFHDLRHYLASLLIAAGADVKVVQTRLRHASATTTLNTYAHLWPDADESTRAAIGDVLAAREESLRNAGASSGRLPRSET
jgi:integrase